MKGVSVAQSWRSRYIVVVLGVVCLLVPSMQPITLAQTVVEGGRGLASPGSTWRNYLPIVMRDHVPAAGKLCRFGIGASSDIARFSISQLRIGWYTNWGAALRPSRPGGIEYLQMVRLTQTGTDSYMAVPQGSTLLAIIAANPGAQWVIGNEPDRRSWQDSIEPHVYARAYHDLYFQIKTADPTARIVAGSIVQPTPLRLQYLDLILDNYRSRYGEQMPVDVWNIHAFILNERSCTYFPEDCWGADIPPGMDVREGERFSIDDNDNIGIFKRFILGFRRWMADRGYQEHPLIITEYGVLMPQEYGFSPARVNAYMNATFDYLSSAIGPTGYPADKNRLVQSWAWYSLTDQTFNGWLYDASTGERTVYGDNFAAYTSKIVASVNLMPVKLWAESDNQAVKLGVQIANNGNVATNAETYVRFFAGDPAVGGIQIGADLPVRAMNGCGNTETLMFTWSGAPSGTYTVWVAVDPQNAIAESDEMDNWLSNTVTIGP